MSIALHGGAAGPIDLPGKLVAAATSGDWVSIQLDAASYDPVTAGYFWTTPDTTTIGEIKGGIAGVIVSGDPGVTAFAANDEVMVRVRGVARAKVEGTTDIAALDPLRIANGIAYAVKAAPAVAVGTDAWVNSADVGALTAALGSKTTSADAAVQGAGYVQVDVQTIATLANELKTDFNNLWDDVNHATTGLRVAITAARTLANDLKDKANLDKLIKGVALEAFTTNSTGYKAVYVCGL